MRSCASTSSRAGARPGPEAAPRGPSPSSATAARSPTCCCRSDVPCARCRSSPGSSDAASCRSPRSGRWCGSRAPRTSGRWRSWRSGSMPRRCSGAATSTAGGGRGTRRPRRGCGNGRASSAARCACPVCPTARSGCTGRCRPTWRRRSCGAWSGSEAAQALPTAGQRRADALFADVDGGTRRRCPPPRARWRPGAGRRLVTAIVAPSTGGDGRCRWAGERVRLHNAGQRTAILARDGGCTFPGCGRRTQLEPHHAPGWAAGGVTSVRDSTTLCRGCHAKVHDEGWTVARVADDEPAARGASAAALLTGADARTRGMVDRLDARRPRFRFEPPTSVPPPASTSSSSSPLPSSLSSKAWPDGTDAVAPGRSTVGQGGGEHDARCCRDGRGEYHVAEAREPGRAVHGVDRSDTARRAPTSRSFSCPRAPGRCAARATVGTTVPRDGRGGCSRAAPAGSCVLA